MAIEVSSATAVDHAHINVVYSENVEQDDKTSTDDALHTPNYTIVGGFRTLRAKDVTAVSATTVRLLVDEMTEGASYSVVVAGTVANDALTSTIADTGVDTAAFTGDGILPTLLTVDHVGIRLLEAAFDEPILQDTASAAVTSYALTPVGTSDPLHVTSVSWSDDRMTATIGFIGSGTSYTLTVNGIMDDAGNYISPSCNSVGFNMSAYSDTTDVYMDTDLGAVHLEVQDLDQRKIDDLMEKRMKEIGYRTHLTRISEALQDAGISRDQSKIKFVKG